MAQTLRQCLLPRREESGTWFQRVDDVLVALKQPALFSTNQDLEICVVVIVQRGYGVLPPHECLYRHVAGMYAEICREMREHLAGSRDKSVEAGQIQHVAALVEIHRTAPWHS